MPGRLELIYGCMFSGKTTELIRRLADAQSAGRRVVALKPARDQRYAERELVSHAGQTFAAVPIDRPEQIESCAEGFDVVGLDEVHFYGPEVVEACRTLVAEGKRVIVAGVDIDHRGRPFVVFPPLQAAADELVHRTARCARCGGEAEISQRMIEDDSPIVIGGADLYEPRCRFCFRRP